MNEKHESEKTKKYEDTEQIEVQSQIEDALQLSELQSNLFDDAKLQLD